MKIKPSKRTLIKERLDMLAAAHNGNLTPDVVVTDAKDPKSPLHDQFTWDVKKAAAEHWIHQARELIRSVRIEVRTETHVIRAPRYVHDPKAGKGQGYVELSSMRSQKDIAREALQHELDRALSALERAQEVALVLGLQGEIAKFLNGLRELKEARKAA